MPDNPEISHPLVGVRATKPNSPIINPDGTGSSERTISVGFDDKTYLIPTIVPDEKGFLVKRSDEDAIRLFREGLNPQVGVFNSVEEADAFAIQRSNSGGRFQKTLENTTDTEFAKMRSQQILDRRFKP